MGGNTKNILIVVGVVIVAFVLFLAMNDSEPGETGPRNGGQRAEQNVILEASADKTSYVTGEEVHLRLNLTNSGTADVCLSNITTGNIQFASLTKDGVPVETRLAPSSFLTSFSEILKSRLVAVASGESMELELKSSLDPGLGAMAFDTTIPEDTSGMATFYNVEKPGQYALELMYEYTGSPSTDCANVFLGPTNSMSITFTVSE